MKLLDVIIDEAQRLSRRVVVPRAELGEAVTGEELVLRDHDGEFYAGSVLELHGDEAIVHLGVRLPEEYALERLRSREAAAADPMQELLDLLGAAGARWRDDDQSGDRDRP